eukprot:sb/3474355/
MISIRKISDFLLLQFTHYGPFTNWNPVAMVTKTVDMVTKAVAMQRFEVFILSGTGDMSQNVKKPSVRCSHYSNFDLKSISVAATCTCAQSLSHMTDNSGIHIAKGQQCGIKKKRETTSRAGISDNFFWEGRVDQFNYK